MQPHNLLIGIAERIVYLIHGTRTCLFSSLQIFWAGLICMSHIAHRSFIFPSGRQALFIKNKTTRVVLQELCNQMKYFSSVLLQVLPSWRFAALIEVPFPLLVERR